MAVSVTAAESANAAGPVKAARMDATSICFGGVGTTSG
jgi:hypothetical protein